jgi:hypothetical protein
MHHFEMELSVLTPTMRDGGSYKNSDQDVNNLNDTLPFSTAKSTGSSKLNHNQMDSG